MYKKQEAVYRVPSIASIVKTPRHCEWSKEWQFVADQTFRTASPGDRKVVRIHSAKIRFNLIFVFQFFVINYKDTVNYLPVSTRMRCDKSRGFESPQGKFFLSSINLLAVRYLYIFITNGDSRINTRINRNYLFGLDLSWCVC